MKRQWGIFDSIHPFPFILLSVICIISNGCPEEEYREKEILLPSSPILTNTQSWAVVTDSYLRMTEERDVNSDVVATLRRGDVLEILRSLLSEKGTVIWYEVKNEEVSGWVQSTSIKMFNNKGQADTASQESRKE